MPNENDTSAQHDAIREAMHGLLVCPVDIEKPGLRILDSGTGDGAFASSFPFRQFTEMDTQDTGWRTCCKDTPSCGGLL